MEAQHYINMFRALTRKIQFSTNLEKDQAMQVAIAVLHEMSKDRRVEEMKRERKRDKEGLATGKQIAYLRALGTEPERDITRIEASEMINDALAVEEALRES